MRWGRRMRLVRFTRSVIVRMCVRDGLKETFFDLHIYLGQTHLVHDWDYILESNGEVCVLDFVRPRGSGSVPADSFNWVGTSLFIDR